MIIRMDPQVKRIFSQAHLLTKFFNYLVINSLLKIKIRLTDYSRHLTKLQGA